MAKPTFRFEVNLKKRKAARPEPQEENQVAEERKWEAKVEERLAHMTPARVREADWEDLLTAEELLAAYNASLARGQRVQLGNRIEAGIEYRVFIDEWENKHVVTQPLNAKGQRISELLVDAQGGVLRLSLERHDGPVLSLDCYMGIGLTELLNDEAELARVPGYSLQLTRYQREAEFLIGVDQVRKRFDRKEGRIIEDFAVRLS